MAAQIKIGIWAGPIDNWAGLSSGLQHIYTYIYIDIYIKIVKPELSNYEFLAIIINEM